MNCSADTIILLPYSVLDETTFSQDKNVTRYEKRNQALRVEDHAGIRTIDGATCTLTYGRNSVHVIHFLDSAQKIHFSAPYIHKNISVQVIN